MKSIKIPVYFTRRNGFTPLFQKKNSDFLFCPFFSVNGKLILPFSYLNTPLLDGNSDNEFFAQLKNKKFLVNSAINLNIDKIIQPKILYSTFLINLNLKEQDIQKHIHKSIKRYVKKNLNEVRISILNTKKALQKFIVLNKLTRKKHGIPNQPDVFFDMLFQNIIMKNKGDIIECSYNGVTIASMIFLKHNNTVLYGYGASDHKHDFLSPNNKIINHAIFYYKKQSFEILDLGRAAKGTGLAQFKQRWGSEQKDIFIYSNIENYLTISRDSLKYNLMTKTWKNMPYWLTTRMNNYVFKRFFLK